MIHLVQATIVALLVSVSSSYVIAKRFSRPAISSRPYKSVEKYKIYSSGPSDASSHTEKTNSSSLFELEVCDYGIMTSLADEHVILGNYNMGVLMAKDAMDTANHSGEENNIYSAYAEGILGDALFGMASYQESAEHYANALTTYEKHYRDTKSPEAIENIGASHLIAHNLLKEKNFEEAVPAWRRALALTQKLLGPKNINVAGCMTNLAVSCIKLGDFGKIPEALLKKAEKIYMEHLPETFDTQATEHADNIVLFDGLLPTAIVSSQLGNLYVKRGDDSLATKYYRFLEKLYRMGNIISDDLAVNALENLAIIHWRLDMLEAAEDFFQQALLIRNNQNYYAASDVANDANINLKLELDSLRRGESPPSQIAPEWEERHRKKEERQNKKFNDEWKHKNFQY